MKRYKTSLKRAAGAISVAAGILVLMGSHAYINGAEAGADNLKALESQGYKVVAQTVAKGEFVGCEFNMPIQFRNGMVFVCLGDQRGRAYEPDVTILRDDNGDVRVLIDGEEYRGTLTSE
jgi:hypothetical protein